MPSQWHVVRALSPWSGVACLTTFKYAVCGWFVARGGLLSRLFPVDTVKIDYATTSTHMRNIKQYISAP